MPDPLQTLEPVTTASGPALKNEMMLPAVLDPWAGHALFEAAHLARQVAGSKVWLVAMAPKAKTPTGDDDGRAEGAVRTDRARRPGFGIHGLVRDGGGAGRRH